MQRRKFIKEGLCVLAVASIPSIVLSKEKGNSMLLKNAKVPPFNSTLMGLIKGVADYYQLGISDEMIFGGTGHAFMINIHETLCPSGPYCWNRKPFYQILSNIGISIKDEGFFSSKNTSDDRKGIEKILQSSLDNGNPCGLVNMEYQLISGYDETGFITSQPWAPKNNFPPKHLTFTEWTELGKEIHVNFFTFKKVKPVAEDVIIRDSLKYAEDVFRNPTAHTSLPYSTGLTAYETWIKAVEAGHGSGHGNWWNATVWGECRSNASSYFGEISKKYSSIAPQAQLLSIDYKSISDKLFRVAEKNLENDSKIALLKEVKELESNCIDKIGAIVVKI